MKFFFRKIRTFFDIEKSLWKSDLGIFWWPMWTSVKVKSKKYFAKLLQNLGYRLSLVCVSSSSSTGKCQFKKPHFLFLKSRVLWFRKKLWTKSKKQLLQKNVFKYIGAFSDWDLYQKEIPLYLLICTVNLVHINAHYRLHTMSLWLTHLCKIYSSKTSVIEYQFWVKERKIFSLKIDQV